MLTPDDLCLAAVIYGTGDGDNAGSMLTQITDALRDRGLVVCGTIQRQAPLSPGHRCDLIGIDIGTAREIPLSADRGPGAQGCRLDSAALEELVGLADVSLDAGADVLVVSRFGKREAEGAGYRSTISKALALGVPVVVTVSSEQLPVWRAFSGGMGIELPADASSASRLTLALANARRSREPA